MSTTISTAPEVKTTPHGISWHLLKKVAIGTGALILAFMLGYIPSSMSSSGALQQNAELQHKLTVAELGGPTSARCAASNPDKYHSLGVSLGVSEVVSFDFQRLLPPHFSINFYANRGNRELYRLVNLHLANGTACA